MKSACTITNLFIIATLGLAACSSKADDPQARKNTVQTIEAKYLDFYFYPNGPQLYTLNILEASNGRVGGVANYDFDQAGFYTVQLGAKVIANMANSSTSPANPALTSLQAFALNQVNKGDTLVKVLNAKRELVRVITASQDAPPFVMTEWAGGGAMTEAQGRSAFTSVHSFKATQIY